MEIIIRAIVSMTDKDEFGIGIGNIGGGDYGKIKIMEPEKCSELVYEVKGKEGIF